LRQAAVLGTEDVDGVLGVLEEVEALGVWAHLDGDGHGGGELFERPVVGEEVDVLVAAHSFLARDAASGFDVESYAVTSEPHLPNAKAAGEP